MYKIQYAALKYYNSVISEECLYIGMLYNNLTTGKRDFRYISNFNRFQSFDDEADVQFIRMYLRGIQQKVENNLFNSEPFNFKEFTKIFINEFRFTEVTEISVDEDEDYVDNLTKLYLKFDFKQKNRLSTITEKKYIRKILSSKRTEFSHPEVLGDFNEEIVFDYIIDNIAIKLFSFKDKDLRRVIPAAKQWSFTASEVKDRMKVVFLYDNVITKDENCEIILNILRKNAEVYQIQEGLEFVLKLIS